MANKSAYSSILSIRAEADLKTSFNWYEEQQKGLGSRFIEETLSRIHKIEQNPELFSIKFKSYREARLMSFPFVIVYRIKKERTLSG